LAPSPARYERRRRIRIGYFSANFHSHAAMYLMIEMFERHDRDRFETIAFSFGPERSDEWRGRAKEAFDRFIDVRFMPDVQVAELARRLEIDIAVDLMGFTQDSRPGIFAARAAPIQASYMGYPGTMGAPFIDYIIADRVIVPDADRRSYAESVVRLPGCYMANCKTRRVAEAKVERSDVGLPETGFVFCSFNNSYKLTPTLFDIWMRLLGRVDGSVLWLWVDDPGARENLRAAASRRGVDPARVVFAAFAPVEEHLGRLPLADLFLDTLPCNAHTTAADALRMGVPVLTCAGQSFAGRVAASVLAAVGLPELVTANLEDYETLAADLATRPGALARLKGKLAANLPTCALFDAERFTRGMERAFIAIYERSQGLQPPVDLDID
jgi:predicted O-linked N-acetylglucosamine transferase (SPINDLY family)